MNFPESQRTGVLAEQDVERLFTSWHWTVGKDRIDVGYDLSVEPDQERFKGARFLVQVKGTNRQKKGHIVATVSKVRLRQYAQNVLPVFLIRASSDGTLTWLHVQQWACASIHKLDGDGYSGIRFDSSNLLNDRARFETYLFEIMRPLGERNDSLVNLAKERESYLCSIDESFGVRVGLRNGRAHYEVYAKSETATAHLKICPTSSKENISKLEDVLEFGIPTSVEVDSFQVEGSKLFDEIGASTNLRGNLLIQSTARDQGSVHFFSASKKSAISESFAIPAYLFNGSKGIAISNESMDSIFDLNIRVALTQQNSTGNVRIGLREIKVTSQPIKFLEELAAKTDWVEKAIANQFIRVELWFRDVRAPMVASGDSFDSMRRFLGQLLILSKLHHVAKALDSEISLGKDFFLKKEDAEDIELAYALLKGEKKSIQINPLDFELMPSMEVPFHDGVFFITTLFSFAVADMELGEIPVRIYLCGYQISQSPRQNMLRLEKGMHGEAWISYHEHDFSDAIIEGKSS
jgi:hypothetical protein